MRIPFTSWGMSWGDNALKFERLPDKPTLEGKISELEKERVRLEGLLDLGPDPDANLTGNQHHALFRTVGTLGQGTRDLHDSRRTQILKMSHELYALRGNAANIIELTVDHVVGERLRPTPASEPEDDPEGDAKAKAKLAGMVNAAKANSGAVEAEEEEDKSDDKKKGKEKSNLTVTQDELDEIWFDKRNRLDQEHERIVTDGELEGETFMMADYFPDEDGHIIIGYFPPENVRKVQKNSMGRDVMLEVDPETPGAPPKKFFVLNSMHDDIEIERKSYGSYVVKDNSLNASPKKIAVNGLVFAKFNGRPGGATRGRPLLMQIMDYIDIHDELIWSASEREKLARMFLLDITDNSIQNPEQGDKKLREMGLSKPPDAPKVFIHNERMKFELMTPGNNGAVGDTADDVLASIYGALGLPMAYSGRDKDAKAGSNADAGTVPGKRMRRKQQTWLDWWVEVIAIMITLRRRATSNEQKLDPNHIKIQHMEVGGKDKSRGAAMIKDLAISVSQMVNDGLITKEAGNEILEEAFDEAGFEVSEKNRGLGDSTIDQLKQMQEAGLTPKENQQPPDPNAVGPTKGGTMRPGNRGPNGGADKQNRASRSVRRGER